MSVASISRWIGQCLVPGDAYKVSSGEAYKHYLDWCAGVGCHAESHRALSFGLRERGASLRRGGRGVRYFVGFRIAKDGEI